VLLWTLEKVLGEKFTPDVQLSWLTVHNCMLKIIIPVAVTEERKAFVGAEKSENRSIKNTLAVGIFDKNTSVIIPSMIAEETKDAVAGIK
jgi:hypothetical protein